MQVNCTPLFPFQNSPKLEFRNKFSETVRDAVRSNSKDILPTPSVVTVRSSGTEFTNTRSLSESNAGMSEPTESETPVYFRLCISLSEK